MLPKHTPCFLSPQSATLAVAFGGIVYGILVIVSSVVSLSTGHNYSTGTDDKSQMFKIIQYSTAGVGGLFVIFSGLLVYGVRSGNRFLHLPWLCWAAVQIFAIFVGAILVLVSLEVTASMMFALVFNMLVAAVFCYSFFVVLEHYRHLALLAQPDAVQYEKQMLRE